MAIRSKCIECQDTGSYVTPWSDAADASPVLRALVLAYPDPGQEDGSVLIKCTHCSASATMAKEINDHS